MKILTKPIIVIAFLILVSCSSDDSNSNPGSATKGNIAGSVQLGMGYHVHKEAAGNPV